MRSDADRLSDILEAIAKIRERLTDSIDAFQADEMLQVWVIHHLPGDRKGRPRRVKSPPKLSSRGSVAANRRAEEHPGA
jgi:hypothetical protein